MSPLPRELHADLVNPQIAAPVVLVPVTFTESSDNDVVVTTFAAARRMKLVRASYVQSVDATAVTSYTATIKNGSTAMTSALDIKTLAEDTTADFVVLSTDDAILADGDILSVDFNQTGGTATSPEIVWMMLEFLLLE